MEFSPLFSLGLTQLDHNEQINRVIGFVPRNFDNEDPNFSKNRSKHRNEPLR